MCRLLALVTAAALLAACGDSPSIASSATGRLGAAPAAVRLADPCVLCSAAVASPVPARIAPPDTIASDARNDDAEQRRLDATQADALAAFAATAATDARQALVRRQELAREDRITAAELNLARSRFRQAQADLSTALAASRKAHLGMRE